jgi:hypothetical protein
MQDAGFSPAGAAKVRSCLSGQEGAYLLHTSALEAKRRSVEKSCTVYISNEYRCTHDGAEW